jgi:acyl-CoA thioesterase-1
VRRSRRVRLVAVLLPLAGLCGACSTEREPVEPAPRTAAPTAAPPAAEADPSTVATAAPPTVVFLGDSLTAGLGLGEEEAYPALVGKALAERGLAVRVVNAGVSGDTTAGGLARLDWLLSQRPAIVLVALGANDGLRAQPVGPMEATLEEIVERSEAAGTRVILAGMRLPPNYGPEYTREFAAVFPRVARRHDVVFLPFLLEGVATVRELNQPDGIHPTAEGQRRIAALVLPVLEPVVREVAAAR